jgi:hypothetical protein
MMVHECNGGDGSAKPGMGNLRIIVRGDDWEMQL